MLSILIAAANEDVKTVKEVLVAKDCETNRHYVKLIPAQYFKISKRVAEISKF